MCANLRAGNTILTQAYGRAVGRYGEGQEALKAALSAYNTGKFATGFTNGYVARYYGAGACDIGPGCQDRTGQPVFVRHGCLVSAALEAELLTLPLLLPPHQPLGALFALPAMSQCVGERDNPINHTAQCGVGSTHRSGGEAQQGCGPVAGASRFRRQHLAAGNLVVGCERQP